MAWLEMTLNTPQGSVNALVTELTALGFEDLCIEDQQEFESFLEEKMKEVVQKADADPHTMMRVTIPRRQALQACALPTELPNH